MKRTFDLLFALILLIIASPLLIVIMLAVYIETGLNPIYVQKRGITLEKGLFSIYKIRTMYQIPTSNNENNGITIKTGLDKFITPLGFWLRKTGVDEFAQLINIIKGDMSFVGPRPLAENDLRLFKALFPEDYKERGSISSKPGITGYWQIFGDRSAGTKNLVNLELYYESNKSILMDTFILLETIPVILFAKHVDAIISKPMNYITDEKHNLIDERVSK